MDVVYIVFMLVGLYVIQNTAIA